MAEMDNYLQAMRNRVEVYLQHGSVQSAALVAQHVVTLQGARMEDSIRLAKCHYLLHEPRKCLSALDRAQLSKYSCLAQIQELLTTYLSPVSSSSPSLSVWLSNLTPTDVHLVTGAHFLLRSLLLLQEEKEYAAVLQHMFGPLFDEEISLSFSQYACVEDLKVNPVVQQFLLAGSELCCAAGQCLEWLEQPQRAVFAYQLALYFDVSCLHAITWLMQSAHWTSAQKDLLYYQLQQHFAMIPPVLTTDAATTSVYPEVLLYTQHLLQPTLPEQEITYQHALQTYQTNQLFLTYVSLRQWLHDEEFDHLAVVFLYVHTLLRLDKVTELYQFLHQWLAQQSPMSGFSATAALLGSAPAALLAYPSPGGVATAAVAPSTVTYYLLASYYYLIHKYEVAIKYLRKAQKGPRMTACMGSVAAAAPTALGCSAILLGHCFVAMEESDQALAAYRGARRLLPTSPWPLLFLAQELLRLQHAEQAYFHADAALALCATPAGVGGATTASMPDDYLRWRIYNELGVACLRMTDAAEAGDATAAVEEALRWFRDAVAAIAAQDGNGKMDATVSVQREYATVYYNYATALRRHGQWEEAIKCYDQALVCCPRDAWTLTSLGLCHHVLRRFSEALNAYHQALALDPKFHMASELLHQAMDDLYQYQEIS